MCVFPAGVVRFPVGVVRFPAGVVRFPADVVRFPADVVRSNAYLASFLAIRVAVTSPLSVPPLEERVTEIFI